ncbi:hypothetical protein EYC84_005649 [Monilinia fructicola]|uniref:Short-chain dehydrogenase/reductase 3 n=1 Tax=Monilinia fructicola TaxID=38448 RepID=A0A5M9JZP1_MONFR|nr:hypothetical protein EYC84_005649 [Monilinia fructicola]
MPMHNGWLPREGFRSDSLGSLIKKTALNPAFTLIFLLLARLVSNYLERGVQNNWVDDKYDWQKEIVLITGGAGGIGGQVVKLLAERGITVVVLDVVPMSYETTSNVHYYKCDITSPSMIATVASRIRSEVGNPTVLINNAGVARGKSILDSTERDVQFLPHMIRNDHGMVVTVASLAAYLSVPNMTDYASSKAAALSFHEGLTAELLTKYNAPKVRTIVINQGYTKTALFQGYKNDSTFLLPALEVDTVAESIVKKILKGKSGQGIFPGFGVSLTWLRAMPGWIQNRARTNGQHAMSNWKGRQVLDVDRFYDEKEREEEEREEKSKEGKKVDGESESTILVNP